ncbi:hypothetical protein AAG906_018585 [Vitis piasezkii]
MAGNASLSTALSVLPGKSQPWLFDSACCNHMTPHSSLFTNLDPAPHPLNIHIADGSTMHGNSLGFVSTSTLSIPGVFHELGTGPRVGRMFPVNNLHLPPVAPVSIAAATAAVSSLPSLALWHSRLGHAPSSRVQHDSISKSIFELIHSDVWGPSPVASIGGSRYFVVFIDDYSRTSQQNGRAERKLRHILDTVRALLLSAKIPAPFWGERLFGSPPNYHHLRSFGSACFVLLQPHEHNKLEPRSRLCCFLGYGETQKGYRCYDPVSHRLRVSRNVVFWEHRLFVELSHFRSSLTNSSVLEIFPDESLVPSANTFDLHLDFSPDIFDASPRQVADEQIIHELPHFEPGSPAPALPEDPPQDIPPRHSTRELDALTKTILGTGYSPSGQIVVGCKWIYKIKTHSMDPLSAIRLVLLPKVLHKSMGLIMKRRLLQVARISSVRALLAFAARKWDLFGWIPTCLVCQVHSTIFRLGYTDPYDSALFLRRLDKGTILLLLYVDDMIIADFLNQQFEMKDLGHLSYFLGLEITHSTDGLYITQAKYASDLLSQAGLTDSKTVDTPLSLPHSYSSGHLLCCSSVSDLSAPRSTHYLLFTHSSIRRYPFHGLFYSARSPLVLRAFSDADWAGDPTDRRSTTVIASSLRISCPCDTTSELLWLRWLLKDLGVSTSSVTPLYCDNQSAIHIAHNDVFHERTKHIEIDCHFIRYHLVHGALKLFSVSSKDQLADIFTKSLPKRRTRDLVDNLKLVSHPP